MPIQRDFECSTEELERRADSYFCGCDENGQKYSISGLCLALDIPHSRFKTLSKLGDEYLAVNPAHRCDYEREHKDEFAQWRSLRALKKAVMRVQAQLEARTDTNAIFQLKQPELGGYTDRPANERAAINVNVRLEGVSGDFAG